MGYEDNLQFLFQLSQRSLIVVANKEDLLWHFLGSIKQTFFNKHAYIKFTYVL